VPSAGPDQVLVPRASTLIAASGLSPAIGR
jgi:hypothetical protein